MFSIFSLQTFLASFVFSRGGKLRTSMHERKRIAVHLVPLNPNKFHLFNPLFAFLEIFCELFVSLFRKVKNEKKMATDSKLLYCIFIIYGSGKALAMFVLL